MSIINGIDYDNLAKIAETSRVPFHVLCERAESGKPIERTKRGDEEWTDYHEAAEILNCNYTHLAGVLTDSEQELEYWGIKWKTRSRVKPQGKRGCGVLFKRADLVLVGRIRRYAHLSLKGALRVNQAMVQGRF